MVLLLKFDADYIPDTFTFIDLLLPLLRYRFQQLCYRAYLLLRRHAHTLITLFVMMLSCGIPQLQTLDDIEYIRRTLQVDNNGGGGGGGVAGGGAEDKNGEAAALKYFQKQLEAAHSDSRWTKFDWFCHGIKHM